MQLNGRSPVVYRCRITVLTSSSQRYSGEDGYRQSLQIIDICGNEMKFNLAWSPYSKQLSLPENYQPLEGLYIEVLNKAQLSILVGILSGQLSLRRAFLFGFTRGLIYF